MLEACLFLGPFSCRLSWLYGFRGDGIRPFAMTGDGHWLAVSRLRARIAANIAKLPELFRKP